jgi:hypothetical protein
MIEWFFLDRVYVYRDGMAINKCFELSIHIFIDTADTYLPFFKFARVTTEQTDYPVFTLFF